MMKKKLPPGTRGKLVLRSVRSPDVEARVAALLTRLVKSKPPERIRAIIRKTPVVLFENLTVEKARRVIAALEKAGAQAAFVPHRRADLRRLKEKEPTPQVVETPVAIVPPPGRRRRKWLRTGLASFLLAGSIVIATVSLFPVFYPEGLFRPPIPPAADLGGLRPLREPAPSVLAVGPADMTDALGLQYRPGPDMRFVEALRIIAERAPQLVGRASTEAVFSVGAVESDGKRIRVQILENGAPFTELTIRPPASFQAGLFECRRLLGTLCARFGASGCIPAAEPERPAAEALPAADPLRVVDALYKMEGRLLREGPDTALYREAALASARLMEGLVPDPLQAADRVAAYGLVFLAAAGAPAAGPPAIRAEAELAAAMGYDAHAARLARHHPEHFQEPYGKMLAAALDTDTSMMKTLTQRSPTPGVLLIAARRYRQLDFPLLARQAANELLEKAPGLYPAFAESMISAARDQADGLFSAYLSRLFSDFSIPPGPTEVGGVLALDVFSRALSNAILQRWPETGALLIDRSRAAAVFETVYAQALSIQFERIAERGPMERAERFVAAVRPKTGAHPLASLMSATLSHNGGNAETAADAAAKLIASTGTPAALCSRAWRLLTGPMARLRAGPHIADRLNGGPAHRILLAGILEDLWLGDAAEALLREALTAAPQNPAAYRALCRITGSFAPLASALAEPPEKTWLLAAAGDYWAQKEGAGALERALAYFERAAAADPGNPAWDRKIALLLQRMGKAGEAAEIFEALIGGMAGDPSQRRADTARLAKLYLTLKRPDKALSLVEPALESLQAAALTTAVRAYEIRGEYGNALEASRTALDRFPSCPDVLIEIAAFNWRLGRYGRAAELLTRANRLAPAHAGAIFEDFWPLLKTAPFSEIEKTRAALAAAGGAGVLPAPVLSRRFQEAGRYDIALALLEKGPHPTEADRIASAARAAQIDARRKGPEAAEKWIGAAGRGPDALAMAAALFQEGLYAQVIEVLETPANHPDESKEYVWLLRTLAWIAADRKPAHLEKAIIGHYRGNWLQQKMARVTGTLSDDPYHAAGRYLLGMIRLEEMMAWADTPARRCQFAYCTGFGERRKGRFAQAVRWYGAAMAAAPEKIAEFRWAADELARWARTGTAHRHRTIEGDRAYLRQEGGTTR